MAFKLRGGMPENFAVELPVTAGVAIATGDLLDISGNVVQRATSSSTIHTIWGVAAETIGTGATTIKVIPITGPGQIWEADCTNDTHASNQLFESCALTDHAYLSNTASDVTGATGVFTPYANVGAVGNRKMLGEFTRLQSTST
ncbi:hypothetical protein A2635_03980 [Candidatus Peribacteria bacterium RIFCSPHIGHO2_01_FULL_51_9]|nr:MAG: hypothetical protein A2635_03980 [Candidatus Peribacteria bacterium RIFCSPHIGHO2_01_FULL_51_9]